MINSQRKVLVIKHGALGDFVLATGPFAAIRQAHKHDTVVLLTTSEYADLAKDSGYFDDVWVDNRPSGLNIIGIQKLRRTLRRAFFTRVYDLQTSMRSNWYFRLMKGYRRPQWSGIASGCSHPHGNPNRNLMHTLERQAEQLSEIGLQNIPHPDLSWLVSSLEHFNLPKQFILIVPGSASHRLAKRWPKEKYIKFSQSLANCGLGTVILGGPREIQLAAEIAEHSDGISLAGKTSFADLATLSRSAIGALGNDTGPMHIAAICGCKSVVLFSNESNPTITAPRGPDVTVLHKENLADLSVNEVAAAFSLR
ncbi:MAG: glycosyltransferase family 9 protein [Pseudomonadota bacterium]|nr:glycosyltransferase family 9 protein [Pseudomonadota bacterium]